jgi:hypothetical protein
VRNDLQAGERVSPTDNKGKQVHSEDSAAGQRWQRTIGRRAFDVAVGIGHSPVTASRNQRLDALKVVILGGVVKRRLALLVDVVRLGASLEAQHAALGVAVLGGALQWRVPVGLHRQDCTAGKL